MTMQFTVQVQADETRGIIQMAPGDMRLASLSAGQTVKVTASRSSHVRVIPGVVDSGNLSVDQTTLKNCGAETDGSVDVVPVQLEQASVLMLRVDRGSIPNSSDVMEGLFDMALTEGDTLRLTLRDARPADATVVKVEPAGAGLVGDRTTLLFETQPESQEGYEDIGGMAEQIALVHEMIGPPLLRPDLFERLGVSAPRGILFTGPPGSGKTLLARTVAAQTKSSFFQIDGPEIVTKHYGESEAAIRKVFAAASKAKSAIIFIDELDSLAPKRSGLSDEKQVERRIVAQLLTLMDGISDRGQIVVMAATNLPDKIDSALRRPGRFDREVVFSPPSPKDRLAILNVHLKRAPLSPDVDLKKIADLAKGYVGADLAALAREAAMAALSRTVKAAGSEANVKSTDLEISQKDLKVGLEKSGPSLLRSNAVAANSVEWADIGGLDEIKTKLRQVVRWPETQKTALNKLRVQPPRGILLSGPPGTGKTLLARALASEEAMNFIPVRPPDLLSQFLGEAERTVMERFNTARQTAPSLLFFDEFEALAPRRGSADAVFDRIVAQLLVEIDGISSREGVTVLAATNRPSAIDPALLRPGRFDTLIEIPLPDDSDRKAIVNVHLRGRELADDVDVNELALRSAGASPAELANLVESAAWKALRRSIPQKMNPQIMQDDLTDAWLEITQRRTTQDRDFLAKDGVLT